MDCAPLYNWWTLGRHSIVSPVLAEFGIFASASRLYNEVLDASHRATGIDTPRRRVKLAPRVVICRIDKNDLEKTSYAVEQEI